MRRNAAAYHGRPSPSGSSTGDHVIMDPPVEVLDADQRESRCPLRLHSVSLCFDPAGEEVGTHFDVLPLDLGVAVLVEKLERIIAEVVILLQAVDDPWEDDRVE